MINTDATDAALLEETILAALRAVAGARIGAAAFLAPDGSRPISFSETFHCASGIADALGAVGCDASSRVAFASPRSWLGIAGFLGISSISICCPTNPAQRVESLEAFFRTLGIAAVVCARDCSVATTAARRMGLPSIRLIDDGTVDDIVGTVDASARGNIASTRLSGERAALLMQTSGTTAEPKIVLLSHANVLAAATGIVEAFCLDEQDLCLNPMPLHHVHGLVSAGISSLLAAAPSICVPSFAPALFVDLFRATHPTWFTGSPAMHIALLDHCRRSNIALAGSRLRFLRSSSAPLPATIIGDLEALFGAPLIETYGLTETASMICTNPLPPLPRKAGSVGLPNIGEMRVIGDAGRIAPDCDVGEICVRGPSVIRGYANLDPTNSELFDGDWLRTGDLGYRDGDGYYFITGRKKELIKRGGLSVFPNEIDNALAANPGVAEAVTFSVPHPTLGEEVVAAVVASGQTPLDTFALRSQLLDTLAAYKVPATILVVDSIPKTETGKIVRARVAEVLGPMLAPVDAPARNSLERLLVELWRDTLARSDFGVTDNVFVLGGDPLRSRSVEQALRERHDLQLKSSEMFRLPTVALQAELLSTRSSKDDLAPT